MIASGSSRSRSRLRRRALRLGHLERVAAAARRDGVRVVDLEPGLLDRLEVVDAARRAGYGALNGSTTTVTPSHSNSWSPSWAPRSKPRPYWKPEQPPPSMATRSTETSVLGGHQVADLRRRRGRQRDDVPGALLKSPLRRIVPTALPATRSRAANQARLCNSRFTLGYGDSVPASACLATLITSAGR